MRFSHQIDILATRIIIVSHEMTCRWDSRIYVWNRLQIMLCMSINCIGSKGWNTQLNTCEITLQTFEWLKWTPNWKPNQLIAREHFNTVYVFVSISNLFELFFQTPNPINLVSYMTFVRQLTQHRLAKSSTHLCAVHTLLVAPVLNITGTHST